MSYDKETLKKFGLVAAAGFSIIALILLLKYKRIAAPLAFISAVFLITAYTLPQALKPVYAVWMKAAFVLGWINTRIILILLFYLVFTPIGLVMRLMRIDPLERRLERERASYWKEKERVSLNPSRYEKQF